MKKILQSTLKINLIAFLFVFSNIIQAQTWDVHSSSISMGRDVVYTSDSCLVSTGTPSPLASGVSMKIDINGNVMWTTPHGGYSLCETFDHGFIIASGLNYTNARLRKLDSNGNLLWDSIYGGPGQSELMSVIQASDSGIVACGFNTNYGDSTFYILKTDKNGNYLWQKNIYVVDFGSAREILEINNNYYIIGYSGSYTNKMITLVRLDANGSIILRKDIPLGYSVQSFAKFDENSFVVCGQNRVTKISLSGDTIWHKQFSGQMWNFHSIEITGNKNIVLSGSEGYMVMNYDYEHNMMLFLNGNGTIIGSEIFYVPGDHAPQSLESVVCLSNTDFVGCGYAYINDTIRMRVVHYHDITIDISNSDIVDKPIIIYPNPTTGKVGIDNKDVQFIEVFDLNGKLILSNQNTNQLDISDRPSGIYFVRVYSNDSYQMFKIIKE